MYTHLEHAFRGLLGEACEIANAQNLDYAVCGGWSPLLRNSKPVRHPGTKDVDLLFADGVQENALKGVVTAFLSKGYLPSAKHPFQVLRIYEVQNKKFVFNIDFLHPKEAVFGESLFVDHLDLPVPQDAALRSFVSMKSIAVPHSKFVFTGFIEEEEIHFDRETGESATVRLPLIDEVGVLVTKSKSCTSAKRPRDLFDIYLAIAQPRDRAVMMGRLAKLAREHPESFQILDEIHGVFGNGSLPKAVAAVFHENSVSVEEALKKIRGFLDSLSDFPLPV